MEVLHPLESPPQGSAWSLTALSPGEPTNLCYPVGIDLEEHLICLDELHGGSERGHIDDGSPVTAHSSAQLGCLPQQGEERL